MIRKGLSVPVAAVVPIPEEEWVTDFPSPIGPETGQVYSEHRTIGSPVLGPASAS